MEGLPRQAQHRGQDAAQDDDARCRRVHASIPAARAARQIPSHPSLRAVGQRLPQDQHRVGTHAAVPAEPKPCRHRRLRRRDLRGQAALRLQAMRRRHDRRADLRARRADPRATGTALDVMTARSTRSLDTYWPTIHERRWSARGLTLPQCPSRPRSPTSTQRGNTSRRVHCPTRKLGRRPRISLRPANADHYRHSDSTSSGPAARPAVSSLEVCPTPALRPVRFAALSRRAGRCRTNLNERGRLSSSQVAAPSRAITSPLPIRWLQALARPGWPARCLIPPKCGVRRIRPNRPGVTAFARRGSGQKPRRRDSPLRAPCTNHQTPPPGSATDQA